MNHGHQSGLRFLKRHNPYLYPSLLEQSPSQIEKDPLNSDRLNRSQANPQNSNLSFNGLGNLLKLFTSNSGLANLLQGFLKDQQFSAPNLRNIEKSVSPPQQKEPTGGTNNALGQAKDYYRKNVSNNGQPEGQMVITETTSVSVKDLKEEVMRLKDKNMELQRQLDRIKGIVDIH